MNLIRLDIGPETARRRAPSLPASPHVVNVSHVDKKKKAQAQENVSVNLKEEIKFKHRQEGRICIVGERSREAQGLGRAPMVIAAVLVVAALNLFQLIPNAEQKGSEALAMASEAFGSLAGASESFLSGEPGAELLLLSDAEALFEQAEQEVDFLLNHSSPWLGEPTQVQSLRNILEAGQLMTEVGVHLSETRLTLMDLPEEGSLTDLLAELSTQHLEPTAHKLSTIDALLADVDLTGTGFEDRFEDYRGTLSELNDLFQLWLQVKDPVLTALGHDLPQHYLILLANNDEQRLGGGFLGSFALAELNEGRLTRLDFQDVYELDNSYHQHIEVPIHELRQLTDEWRLRDSNISVDYPTSAQHAMQLSNTQGLQSVDGVITVNLSSAQSLIETVGSLYVPSLDTQLDAETFPVVVSTLVEAKFFGADQPKSIVEEVIHSFKESLTQPNIKAPLALTLLEEIQKKQILIYHRDESVQQLIESFDLDNSMPTLSELDHDYALVALSNIGGNKTDRYMQTHISHDTHMFGDGSMMASLTVQRTHTFTDDTLAWIKSTLADYGFHAWNPDFEGLIGNSANRSGLRFYLPNGGQLIEVEGDAHRDDIQLYYDQEQGVSYYYLDQSVDPGQSKSVTLHYQLPWTFTGEFPEYHFELFKQPGLKSVSYQKTVTAPDDILLSSEPLATEFWDDSDYVLSGPLQNDVEVKLLYR